MCTRFFIEKENAELQDIMEAAKRSALTMKFLKKMAKPLLTSGEIRPTDLVPVIAPNRKGNRTVFPMKWGFTLPKSTSPVVNARVETASGKPLFAEHWHKHRCIVPASWYYEWEHFTTPAGRKKTGKKYVIQPVGTSVTYLCGLYRFEDDLPVFTVLTREPGEGLKQLHDRMPLILPADKIDAWISINADPGDLLSSSLTDMIFEPAEEEKN
ncbi:MAG: SOS response-associated peptidase [Lachnospiraceae bacterium]|nr:SOS response-associated peptidase [Lachnospiraceae bacterium]